MLPSSDEVPPAVAFFPLNSQSLQSFPLPDYSGTASGAGVVSDELFGSALLCSREDQDLVGASSSRQAASHWLQCSNQRRLPRLFMRFNRVHCPAVTAVVPTCVGWLLFCKIEASPFPRCRRLCSWPQRGLPAAAGAPLPLLQVALDAVQYARSGAFTVNLWFRPVNMSGTSRQSHTH